MIPPRNFASQTIWTGDCLDVMRGMNSATVDLIYLDPPFNSNADYAAPIGSAAAGAAFKDTWTLSDLDVEWINLIETKHPKMWRVLMAAMTPSDKSYLAYMAARLMEMPRLLKPTGSIYLHCDSTASHSLKLLMDSIFGHQNFRSEVIWKRAHSHNSARRYGPIHDVILFYTASDMYRWTKVRQPYDPDYIERYFKFDDGDGRGRYWTGDITGSGTRDGETGKPWRGFDPTAKGRHWMVPPDELDKLDADNRVYWPPTKGAWPKNKRYLSEAKGVPLQDIITDIRGLSTMGAAKGERVGYPTQKPLALLERFIAASSNPGDVVLDPFCGCATACIAAQRLDREWVGIDISPKAADLVKLRMRDQLGLFYTGEHRTDLPQRTDLGTLPPYNCAENRKALYGEQGGHCNGCAVHFLPQNLTVDHIIARAKGGTDHLSNLQLLCGHCNSVKGDRGMEYLRVKLELAA